MIDTSDNPRIAIPYFTGKGHTKCLAEAVAAGAGSARLIEITAMSASDWTALDEAEAIIFGAPTYMGSTAARYDMFLEEAAIHWPEQAWANKVAGGFTVATYASGDKLSTLMRLTVYATQMGMIWVGQGEIGAPVNPDKPGINASGSWLGLMATSSRDKQQLIEADDLETARRYGARIAKAVKRWRI